MGKRHGLTDRGWLCVIGFVACATLGSCARVLGDFEVVPGEGGAGGSGTGGSTGTGGMDGGDMADHSVVDVACTGTATACNGRDLLECNNGAFVRQTTCPYVCMNGACVGMCLPGDTKCEAGRAFTCKIDGTWD